MFILLFMLFLLFVVVVVVVVVVVFLVFVLFVVVRSSSSSSSSYGCRAPAEGDRAAPTTPESPRRFLPWKVPVFIFKSLLVPRALLVDFRLRVQTPARSFVFPQRPGAGDEEDAETHRARFAFASWIPPVVVVAVLAVIAVVTVTTSAHAAVVAAVPEFSLLLRFHPERRRTGAATFVGRGTAAAAAVVIIIVRRRNEKRRSVKKIERERKENSRRRPLALSRTNKQTNGRIVLSSRFEGITRRFWGKRTHFVSQSHLREEVTEEEEEGIESHLLGNPNPSGASLFEPLFPPFFAIAFIIIICVVFLLVVRWCFLDCFLCCPLCLCGQRLTVVVLRLVVNIISLVLSPSLSLSLSVCVYL